MVELLVLGYSGMILRYSGTLHRRDRYVLCRHRSCQLLRLPSPLNDWYSNDSTSDIIGDLRQTQSPTENGKGEEDGER